MQYVDFFKKIKTLEIILQEIINWLGELIYIPLALLQPFNSETVTLFISRKELQQGLKKWLRS